MNAPRLTRFVSTATMTLSTKIHFSFVAWAITTMVWNITLNETPIIFEHLSIFGKFLSFAAFLGVTISPLCLFVKLGEWYHGTFLD